MEALICLALLFIFWLICSKRWKRWLIQPLAVATIAFIIVTSHSFVSLLIWGLNARLPADSGDRVDAIAILGRGEDLRGDRLAVAWQLWQAKRADKIFASGMMDARVIVQSLEDRGISSFSLAGEECSQTTEENAAFTSAIVRPRDVKKILLVTDSFHIWRSFLVFRGFEFTVVPHATSLDSRQFSTAQQLVLVIREYLGLIDYALTDKFRQRSPQELDNPSPEIRQRIIDWNCRVPDPARVESHSWVFANNNSTH